MVLWLLFVYMEAAVRLRDLRHLPFHLDLCRPFAAHWWVLVSLSLCIDFFCCKWQIKLNVQKHNGKCSTVKMGIMGSTVKICQIDKCITVNQWRKVNVWFSPHLFMDLSVYEAFPYKLPSAIKVHNGYWVSCNCVTFCVFYVVHYKWS